MKKLLSLVSLVAISHLSAETKVVALAGSVRTDSYNKKLIQEAATIARDQGATVTIFDFKEHPIPLYDGDMETTSGMPENAKLLRKNLIQSDVIIISTPEYNGSISAVLKNAIDWASRTEKGEPTREAFKGKKVILLSCAGGASGGSDARMQLSAIIKVLGGDVMPQQFSIGTAHEAFDESGHLKHPEDKQRLQAVITSTIIK